MSSPLVVASTALIVLSLRPHCAARGRSAPAVTVRPIRRDRVRLVVAGVGVGALLHLFVPAGLTLASILVWRQMGRAGRAERRKQAEVERALPETIDLLSLVVSAGLPARTAIETVAPRAPEPCRDALEIVTRRARAGQPFADAVHLLPELLGPPARPLTSALLAAERDGVALSPALERCAHESRRRRRVRAEEAARRVPVLMLFPLVCCVLPAFGLLTVVPLLSGALSDLGSL